MPLPCSNPCGREAQQGGTRQGDSSSSLHSPPGARAGGSTRLPIVLCSEETRADTTWKGKGKQTKPTNQPKKPHTLLPVPESRNEICFRLICFCLLSSHNSQTSPHSRGQLASPRDTAKSYACPAQLSSPAHILSLSKAQTA